MTCWTDCFWSLAHFLGILILFVKSSTPDMRFISINPTSAVWPMTENRNYLARSSCHLKIHVMLTPDIPRLTRLQKKNILSHNLKHFDISELHVLTCMGVNMSVGKRLLWKTYTIKVNASESMFIITSVYFSRKISPFCKNLNLSLS